ncbi:MAG: helix-turn-helix domain-containing protein [Paracoccaceae bacterium]
MNHAAGKQPRDTAFPTAVGTMPNDSASLFRPILSANSFAACLSMSNKKPHIVDRCKSTTGGLNKKPQKAIQARMASPEAQYFQIASRLTAIRTGMSNLNQKEFALKNGFNVTQWNNWEAGTRRIPIEAAEKLCRIYGVTLDFIYMGRRDGLSEKTLKVV